MPQLPLRNSSIGPGQVIKITGGSLDESLAGRVPVTNHTHTILFLGARNPEVAVFS
jgi:hypothetical protein